MLLGLILQLKLRAWVQYILHVLAWISIYLCEWLEIYCFGPFIWIGRHQCLGVSQFIQILSHSSNSRRKALEEFPHDTVPPWHHTYCSNAIEWLLLALLSVHWETRYRCKPLIAYVASRRTHKASYQIFQRCRHCDGSISSAKSYQAFLPVRQNLGRIALLEACMDLSCWREPWKIIPSLNLNMGCAVPMKGFYLLSIREIKDSTPDYPASYCVYCTRNKFLLL